MLFISCKKDNGTTSNNNPLTPDAGCGTITDYDGHVYNSVTIGKQCWMKENLKVIHYNNGDVIPDISGANDWVILITGAYCSYNNNDNNSATYGLLYNWYAVNDSRKLCPAGWHVPGDGEWQELIDYLGGNAVAGGKMKEAGTNNWESPNTEATNASGFTALPGGFRTNNYGTYFYKNEFAHFWSSTDNQTTFAWLRFLNYNDADVVRDGNYGKGYGLSVRCVKD